MQQPFGLLGSPPIDQQTHHADPKAVHHDGNRNGRQKHQRTLPEWRMKQIGRQEAQAEQRIEVAQPATGLDYLQLINSEIDDISRQINGNSKQPDEEDAEL